MSSSHNNSHTYLNQNKQFHENGPRHHHHQQQWEQQRLLHQQQQWLQQQRQRQQHHQHKQHQKQKVVVMNSDDRNYSDDHPKTEISRTFLSPSINRNTNFDSFLLSFIPVVRARRLLAEVNGNCPFFYIGDLWESFIELSAYGAGVPLELPGEPRTTYFYSPSLSGMQIYVKPRDEEMTVGSTNVTGASSSSASCNLVNFSTRGDLEFEFLETMNPYHRQPLYEKALELVPKYPELSNYRSSDILPSSWVAVLWSTIYEIPTRPSPKPTSNSFLTIHSLSTQPGSINEAEFSKTNIGPIPDRIDLRLPIIGLATYKFHGSVINPNNPEECMQEKQWFDAATNWLGDVKAHLPDHAFFRSRRLSR